MVVLICARRKTVETASCSCFVSAVSSHETNFCLFQRGCFQATRRNTTDIPTACTKTKVAFSSQFDFFICARRKAVETASCSCFVSAVSSHETNFCLFQRGRFQTTRRNTTDIPTACTKTKVAFSLQFDGCFDLCKAQKGGNSVVQLFCFGSFVARNKLLPLSTWTFSDNKAKMSNLLILQHFFTLFALFNKQWYNYL